MAKTKLTSLVVRFAVRIETDSGAGGASARVAERRVTARLGELVAGGPTMAAALTSLTDLIHTTLGSSYGEQD